MQDNLWELQSNNLIIMISRKRRYCCTPPKSHQFSPSLGTRSQGCDTKMETGGFNHRSQEWYFITWEPLFTMKFSSTKDFDTSLYKYQPRKPTWLLILKTPRIGKSQGMAIKCYKQSFQPLEDDTSPNSKRQQLRPAKLPVDQNNCIGEHIILREYADNFDKATKDW